MQTTGNIALSGQVALQHRMDVMANNIANSSTPGFKGETLSFEEYVVKGAGKDTYSFVKERGTTRDMAQGILTPTDNPLDFALDGEGFLAVQTPLGTRYTRNGRFQLDANNQIVNNQGYPLLDENDRPITLPANSSDIRINTSGEIVTAGGRGGKIGVSKFDNPQTLVNASNGLYVASEDPKKAPDVKLRQGMLEESNVQSVSALTQLLSLQREYGGEKDMIDGEHQRLTSAIEKLTKASS